MTPASAIDILVFTAIFGVAVALIVNIVTDVFIGQEDFERRVISAVLCLVNSLLLNVHRQSELRRKIATLL